MSDVSPSSIKGFSVFALLGVGVVILGYVVKKYAPNLWGSASLPS